MTDPEKVEQTLPGTSPLVQHERLCDEFEAAWHAGRKPQIEAFLARATDSSRDKLLEALLEIELDSRAKAGESLSLEEYRNRFPADTDRVEAIFQGVAKGRRLGDYELLEELGRGGMGVVYRARQVLLNQIVAVKVLPDRVLDAPTALARFHREMQSIGGLDHPNIVGAHNAGEVNGVHFLVMEYVDGLTLQVLLTDRMGRKVGPLSVGEACEVIRQVATGLQYAFEKGVVHRDIKPANLMLSQAGVVKILDLGLAKLRNDHRPADEQSGPLTQEGTTMGTVDYMAPEQWEDSSKVDIRADIYSLGCTLFYLLTGQPPFGGKSFDSSRRKLMAHAVAPVPSLVATRKRVPGPGCPAELDGILARLMAKEPQDRFATPGEVAEAMEEFADADELTHLAATVDLGDESPSASAPVTRRSGIDTGKKVSRHSAAHQKAATKPDSAKPRYRRTIVLASLAAALVLAALLTAWLASRSDPNALTAGERQQLRADLGTLPGLNGRPWFEEIPWFTPSIRARLIQAIDAQESAVYGVPLRPLLQQTNREDVAGVYRELASIAQVIAERLPPDQRDATCKMQLLNREDLSEDKTRKELQDIAGQLSGAQAATELHLRAAILHRLSPSEEAKQCYSDALAAYSKQAPALVELRALCLADQGQLCKDLKDYKSAVVKLHDAGNMAGSVAFKVACLCQEAEACRRWDDLGPAQERLGEAQALLDKPDGPPLGLNHPLRAAVLEQQSFVALAQFRLTDTIRLCGEANSIRMKNREWDNPRSWRGIVINKLVPGMAKRLLGKSASAVQDYRDLLDQYVDSRLEVKGKFKPATGWQKSELCYLRCVIAEKLADCYLFDGKSQADQTLQAGQAAEILHDAILRVEDEPLDQSSQWPTVMNVRYKLCIALLLSKRPANEVAQRLEKVERLVKEKEAELKANPGQGAGFATARAMAAGMLQLGSQNPEEQGRGAATIQRMVLDRSKKIELRDRELLLLAMEQLFRSGRLDPDATVEVARRMWTLSEELRRSPDKEFTQQYLQRYFRAAVAALKESADAGGGPEVAGELKRFQELAVP